MDFVSIVCAQLSWSLVIPIVVVFGIFYITACIQIVQIKHMELINDKVENNQDLLLHIWKALKLEEEPLEQILKRQKSI
jgi:hypothetical protein